jgi:5-methylcytosine-specific restriction endonuclease McrA
MQAVIFGLLCVFLFWLYQRYKKPVEQVVVSQPLPKIELTYIGAPTHTTRWYSPTPKYIRIPLTQSQRFEILRRDKFTCQYCGRKPPEVTLEVDHIFPVSKGGTNDPGNLTTSCYDCNRGKGADLLI